MTNRRQFRRKHQRAVKFAVVEAKEDWILRRVAMKVKQAKKDGRQRWQGVKQLQMAFAGQRHLRLSALLKENGEMTKSPLEFKQRWHKHFSKILNISSQYQQEVHDSVPLQPIVHDLDGPLSFDELLSALSKLKKGKAGRKTGIVPPELIPYAVWWSRTVA